MNKVIRTVIVDDNETLVNDLKTRFEVNSSIKVVETFLNGEEALGYIIANSDSIDLILMDLLIPKLDGMALLEELKKQNINIKTIVLSSYKDDMLILNCRRYNVAYYFIKPCSITSLERRIVDCFTIKMDNKTINENLDLEICQLLHNLGIPSHIRGYKYIRDGIMLIYNTDTVSKITKEIYPQIANKYETTASRVERAIRHAIEVSWLRGDIKLMEDLFGFSVSCDKAKPTNSEFLSTIADRLKIDQKLK